MIIAFSGVSGAGKSSLMERVNSLDLFGKEDVCVKEEDRFFFVDLAKNLLGEGIFSNYKDHKFYESSGRKSIWNIMFTVFSSVLYPIAIYVDYLWDYVYYELLYSKKVLFRDRYIYDYSITLDEVLGIRSRVFRFLFENFPRPYLLFYIKVGEKTAISRNKNKDAGMTVSEDAFQKKLVRAYDRFFDDGRFVVISGEMKIQKAVKIAEKYLLNKAKLLNIHTLSISGLDGSGKSTLARGLDDYCRQIGRRVKIVHFYHDNLVYKVLKFLGIVKVVIDDEQMRKNRARASVIREKGKPFLWALATFIDSSLQSLVAKLAWPRSLIIYDRYLYDYYVSFEFLDIWWREFFWSFIFQVDKAFLMAIDADKAYDRKPENIREFFIEGERKYKIMAKKWDLEVIRVGEKEKEEILEEVLSKI